MEKIKMQIIRLLIKKHEDSWQILSGGINFLQDIFHIFGPNIDEMSTMIKDCSWSSAINESDRRLSWKEISLECLLLSDISQNSVALNNASIDKDTISKLTYLAFQLGDKEYAFSKLCPNNKVLKEKKFLEIVGTKEPKIQTIQNCIFLSGTIDGYFKDDKLYYFDIEAVKDLHSDFRDEIIKKEEVIFSEFKELAIISLADELELQKCWSRNKRKMQEFMEVRAWWGWAASNFTDEEIRKKYKEYAEKYMQGGKTPFGEDGNCKMKICSNKDLTNALQILQEHYYKTEITQQKREATDSQPVKKI